MRKLFVLILVAALVGVIISKTRRSNAAAGGADGEAAPAVAAGGVEPESAAGADPTALPAAEPEGAGLERAVPPRVAASASVARSAEPGRSPSAPRALLMSSRAPAPAAEAAATRVPLAEPPARLGGEVAAQIERAAVLLKGGRRVEARALLSRLYLESRGQVAAKLRELLDRINAELVFNPRSMEGAQIHVVESGENLTRIGKRYGVCGAMIQRLNGMQDDRLRVGQRLKIIVGRTSAVAVKSEFRLTLLMDGVYVKEYPIGIGKEDKTPSGELVVDNKVVRAPWTKPGGEIVKYGEEGYLLGERWIGFRNEPGAHGLGIHGTDDEASIGTKCSNGCLRMKNADVIELYDFIQPGSLVTIYE